MRWLLVALASYLLWLTWHDNKSRREPDEDAAKKRRLFRLQAAASAALLVVLLAYHFAVDERRNETYVPAHYDERGDFVPAEKRPEK
jgi:peptidoglycan/LPS O-acetylase OafA/YrhL